MVGPQRFDFFVVSIIKALKKIPERSGNTNYQLTIALKPTRISTYFKLIKIFLGNLTMANVLFKVCVKKNV